MENTPSEHRVPSCALQGPGPKYKLPGLTGFIGHDPSRRRGPAYSVRRRTGKTVYSDTPGPTYETYRLTNRGIMTSPAFAIGQKFGQRTIDTGPSAADYKTEQVLPMNHERRPPAYTILSRKVEKLRTLGPGPNQFMVPTCIGPKIPDKRAQGAYSMAFNHPKKLQDGSPGPAAYKKVKIDLVKRSGPAYSFAWRHKLFQNDHVPGPLFDGNYNPGRRAPKFSFGLRHSQCAVIPSTTEDEF